MKLISLKNLKTPIFLPLVSTSETLMKVPFVFQTSLCCVKLWNNWYVVKTSHIWSEQRSNINARDLWENRAQVCDTHTVHISLTVRLRRSEGDVKGCNVQSLMFFSCWWSISFFLFFQRKNVKLLKAPWQTTFLKVSLYAVEFRISFNNATWQTLLNYTNWHDWYFRYLCRNQIWEKTVTSHM